MRLALAAVVVLVAAGCGPEDSWNLYEVAHTRAADGTAFLLMIETGEFPETPDLPGGPGLPALAHAYRYTSLGWTLVETKPTRWEACDSLGIWALDAARPNADAFPMEQ